MDVICILVTHHYRSPDGSMAEKREPCGTPQDYCLSAFWIVPGKEWNSWSTEPSLPPPWDTPEECRRWQHQKPRIDQGDWRGSHSPHLSTDKCHHAYQNVQYPHNKKAYSAEWRQHLGTHIVVWTELHWQYFILAQGAMTLLQLCQTH